MLKKMFVLGGAVALLLGLVFGRSHVATTVGMVKQQVKDNVPIEFEIKRARQMVTDLAPEIEQNLRLIAQEEVRVAHLEDRVASTADRLAADETKIMRLKNHLASGEEYFVAAKHAYTSHEVKSDLVSRFEQFKTELATHESTKEILSARQLGLQAARERLEEMLKARRQLEVEIEHHVANLAMVDVQKASSSFQFDDSKLARTRELVEDIRTRIEVQAKLANAELHHLDRIPMDEVEADVDISEEITRFFADKNQDGQIAVNP